MIKLSFYTTEGCHLCDKSLAIINEVHRTNPDTAAIISLEIVDIANDDALIIRYGNRIPVIAQVIADERPEAFELNYPFGHQDYVNFLNRLLDELRNPEVLTENSERPE